MTVLKINKVNKKFHARHNAKKRTYLYLIINRQSPLTLQKNKAWHIRKKLDLNAMKNSIENRSPYLDKDLFNFCFSIPPKLLIQNGYGKFLLREAMQGILNDQIRLDYQKKGFNCSINSLINLSEPSTINYLTEWKEDYFFL